MKKYVQPILLLSALLLFNSMIRAQMSDPIAITSSWTSPRTLLCTDLNGDDHTDIVAMSFSQLLYLPGDGKGAFGKVVVIATNLTAGNVLAAGDIDGDGLKDLLIAQGNTQSTSKLKWAKQSNPDKWSIFDISSPVYIPEGIALGDFDMDGDLDIAATSSRDSKAYWLQNTDGKGAFGPAKALETDWSSPLKIRAADIDGDGDTDLCAINYFNGDMQVAWWNNTDGKGGFNTNIVATLDGNNTRNVLPVDLDDDQDLDLLVAWYSSDRIGWYENTNGKGAFSNMKEIAEQTDLRPESISVFKNQNTGALQIFVSSSARKVWRINRQNNLSFSAPELVLDSLLFDPFGTRYDIMDTGDFNEDGVADIVVLFQKDKTIQYYLGQGMSNANTIFLEQDNPIKIFPNPGITHITISWTSALPQPATVRIFDISGKTTLFSQTLAPGITSCDISTSSFQPGIYTAQVQLNQTIETHLFIVK